MRGRCRSRAQPDLGAVSSHRPSRNSGWRQRPQGSEGIWLTRQEPPQVREAREEVGDVSKDPALYSGASESKGLRLELYLTWVWGAAREI